MLDLQRHLPFVARLLRDPGWRAIDAEAHAVIVEELERAERHVVDLPDGSSEGSAW